MNTPTPSFTSRSPKLSAFPAGIVAAFEDGDPNVQAKFAECDLVDAVLHIYDALGKGDVDAMLQWFNDDIVLDLYSPQEFTFIRHAEGKSQAKELILRNFQLLEDQAPQIISVVAQGNTVMLVLKESGVIRATNSPYSVQAVQKFVFRAGRVSNFNQIAAHI